LPRRTPWVHIKEAVQARPWRYAYILHYPQEYELKMTQDAYILSAMLTDVTGTPSLESQTLSITHIYDAIRRPIGNASIAETKACGKLKGLTDDEKELPFMKTHDETVPHEVLVAYVKKLESRWRWLRDAPTRIEEQGQDALKLLRSSRKPESKL